jgi:hypothetical protein
VRLVSLGNKGSNKHHDEGNYVMGAKGAYMDYSNIEVGTTGVNGVVMNDEEDGKNQMIDVEMDKNG